ncbi:MAG: hypothetical protein IJ777_04825 [Clostridia bacterium]|nr:hypothetical protein [Clostridia bacterium]
MRNLNRGVDFSKLPIKEHTKTRHIDWDKAVGQEVPFHYDKMQGKLLIVEHKSGNHVVVRYKDKEKTTRTNHLAQGKIRDLLNIKNKISRGIDFSSVPKKNGKNDWAHSIGCILPFYYDTIKGNLEIIDYRPIKNAAYLTIKYKDTIKDIRTVNILDYKIAKIVGYHTEKFNYEVGEQLVDSNKNIKIIDREKYMRNGINIKKYQYQCNTCHYIGWIDEGDLDVSKKVCSHCTQKIAMKGKDDIATQAPWMIKFFQDSDKHLIYECRRSSSKEIYPICPYCGEIRKRKVKISTIYRDHSIGCPKCNDGVPYPEKFMIEVFNQIKANVIFHPTLEVIPWCKPHIYDFYDPDRKIIMEVNGIQHYQEVKTFGLSLSEVKKNDKIKRKKAIKNGNTYIELDCRYSKMEYIKESLTKNKQFSSIYHLKNVDWKKCDEQGKMPMYIKIYEYKQENPDILNKQVAEKFNVSGAMVSKAINIMSNLT